MSNKEFNELVTLAAGVPVTTSLSIAAGTGNEHSAVIKLVRRYQEDLEAFGGVRFEIRPFETAGGMQSREIAILNERQATLLISYMKNSEIVRAFKVRLVKRFYEMAQQLKSVDPAKALNDPATLRQTLLTYVEKVIELEATVKEQAPKVAALDRIATADGSLCITDAAKHLQMRPKDLFDYLKTNVWIYRRNGNSAWHGYQHRVQQLLIEHKVTVVSTSDGTEKLTQQVRITPKGLRRIAAELGDMEKSA